MPVVITSQDSDYPTRLSTQRKPLKNPRGLQYYYALFYYLATGTTFELRIYRSIDGVTWSNYQVVKTFTSDVYDSASLWPYDDGSKLIIYIIYTDTDGNMFYKQGTIADGVSTLTLSVETQFIWGTDPNYASKGMITRANNGFLWIAYNRYGSGELFYRGCSGKNLHTPEGWTRVGASPYLNGIDYPTNYIWSKTQSDEIGEFIYIDTVVGGACRIEFYCKSDDGNDKFAVYCYDYTFGWFLAGDITPGVTWSWKSIDLTPFGITTVAKINALRSYLVYIGVSAAKEVDVDASRLRILPDASHMVYCRASTKANPQSSALSEDASLGDDHIHVVNPERFAVDDYITIHDKTYPTIMENFRQITSIVGDALYVTPNLGWSFAVADNAQAMHWSNEYQVAQGSVLYENVPTVVPLESTHDALILWKYRQDSTLTWRRAGKEMSWDGAGTFTEGFSDPLKASNTTPLPQGVLPAVCDSDNRVHHLHQHNTNLYHDFWVVGSGFDGAGGYLGTLLRTSVPRASLSIDRTAAPNVLYAFLLKVGVDHFEVYKTDADVISWAHEADIEDTGEYLSACYRDLGHQLYMVYYLEGDVKFLEYPPLPPPPVVKDRPPSRHPSVTVSVSVS